MCIRDRYTIVGEIDRTVSSAYNGYPAYGWLNLEETPKDARACLKIAAN